MIVYVVRRRWFEKLDQAEAYRKSIGQKPGTAYKLSVGDRTELCALLNALCDPPAVGAQTDSNPVTVRTEILDQAYVSTEIEVPDYVPRFLLDDAGKKIWDARHASR